MSGFSQPLRENETRYLMAETSTRVLDEVLPLSSAYHGSSNAQTPSMSEHQAMTPLQHCALVLSHILALLAVILVVVWVHRDAMGGGGLSWATGSKLVFNWHPVMMTIAYAFMTLASLTFRMKCYASNRSILKLIHGVKWSIAAVCGAVGLTAVFQSHNDAFPPIANLYSLHSWIGLATIFLYLYQMSSGILFFGVSILSSPQRRAMMLTYHRYLGPCIYIITGTTILLGIQEKEGFIGCSYQVTTPDYNPLIHYFDIPLACRISHGLGLVVLLMMVSTTYALYQPYPWDGERTRTE